MSEERAVYLERFSRLASKANWKEKGLIDDIVCKYNQFGCIEFLDSTELKLAVAEIEEIMR